ncbi:MAG TPA: lipoyl(octanoyl) transferase LipB [Methylotenera sp.]|nr:lipoyl(octanoyl) transferase LipB [Methylotenera sp.]HPH05482.1 lipoyl(octanoyl) transferase LipB [Methylotenera sp.]HPN01381.1 lipoyl(octanoyl) transferase LipB [Methylotenera sp.]
MVKHLGVTDFEVTWHAMQDFTQNRSSNTPDELWLTQHPAVYTLGLNRKNVRPPLRDDIPLIEIDRGGKITYHGLGQVVIYLLVDLNRRKISVRQLVSMIESSIISLLARFNVAAIARTDAPGVYINEKKIAALGLRLKNNCCYHGLSLNVAMDLTPFSAIDPCGYAGLEVTQMQDLGIPLTVDEVGIRLLQILADKLAKI